MCWWCCRLLVAVAAADMAHKMNTLEIQGPCQRIPSSHKPICQEGRPEDLGHGVRSSDNCWVWGRRVTLHISEHSEILGRTRLVSSSLHSSYGMPQIVHQSSELRHNRRVALWIRHVMLPASLAAPDKQILLKIATRKDLKDSESIKPLLTLMTSLSSILMTSLSSMFFWRSESIHNSSMFLWWLLYLLCEAWVVGGAKVSWEQQPLKSTSMLRSV